jgi:hypothetical protein
MAKKIPPSNLAFQALKGFIGTRDLSRDDWIKESKNGNEVLGCFGQSGLQRKKTSQLP